MKRNFILILLTIFVFAQVNVSVKAAKTGSATSAIVLKLIDTVKQVKKSDPDNGVLLTPEENEHNEELARQILSEAPFSMLNEIAWHILTEVEKEKRDLGFALQAAEKANTMTEGKSPMILDTYALALFENGQVQAAIEKQTQALELAKGNEPMVKELRARLEKFQAAVK